MTTSKDWQDRAMLLRDAAERKQAETDKARAEVIALREAADVCVLEAGRLLAKQTA